MKSKRTIIIFVMILAAAAGAWYLWKRKQAAAEPGSAPAPPLTPAPGKESPNQGTGATGKEDKFPLTIGSRGKYVKALQQMLKDKHKAPIAVDGIFGPATKSALTRAFKIYSVNDLEQFNSLFK